MPITGADFDRYMAEAQAEEEARARSKPSGGGKGSWSGVFEKHPEGGGPFGGRNNAAIRFVGFLRAKSFPYDAGQEFARTWNHKHCVPPIPDSEMEDIVSRAWATWIEGGHEDEKPEDFQPKAPEPKAREVLTIDELLDLPEPDGGMWLVDKVLIRGGIHFLSAPSSGGKSWVALDLCRAMTTGGQWLGRDIPSGAVLYVDEEMGGQQAKDRTRRLRYQRGTPFYYLGKQGIKLHDPADVAFVCQECRSRSISLVVLDTLSGVRPGLKENEAEHVSQLRTVFNQIVATGATLLVLHHDRKGKADEDQPEHERMRGSGDLAAMADMAYGIRTRGGVHTLKATKNRALSETEALSVDFELFDEEDGISLRVVNAQERSGRIVDAMSRRVMDALWDAKEPINQSTLATAVGGKKEVVIAAVERLVDAGEVVVSIGPKNAKMYAPSQF